MLRKVPYVWRFLCLNILLNITTLIPHKFRVSRYKGHIETQYCLEDCTADSHVAYSMPGCKNNILEEEASNLYTKYQNKESLPVLHHPHIVRTLHTY